MIDLELKNLTLTLEAGGQKGYCGAQASYSGAKLV